MLPEFDRTLVGGCETLFDAEYGREHNFACTTTILMEMYFCRGYIFNLFPLIMIHALVSLFGTYLGSTQHDFLLHFFSHFIGMTNTLQSYTLESVPSTPHL